MTITKKVQVYHLSKELGIPNKEIIDKMKQLEIPVKSHASIVPPNVVEAFRNTYAAKAPVENSKPLPEVKVEKKVEPKPEIKQESKIFTQEEAAIAARLASQDSDWQTITEESLGDFSLAEDAYKLPKPAKKSMEEKQFAFRWIEKTSGRFDAVTSMEAPMKWWPVNSTQPPVAGLAKYVDSNHGGIQKHDQILMFKPYFMYQAHQDAKHSIAMNKDAQGDIKNRDNTQELDSGGRVRAEWKAGKNAEFTGRDDIMGEADYSEADSSLIA